MQNWQINIPVLGLTSSGKSTLLNGLFGLPLNEVSKLRTTFHPVKFILDSEEGKMDVKEISAKITENNKKPVTDELLCFRVPKPEYMSKLPKRINYAFIDYPGLDDPCYGFYHRDINWKHIEEFFRKNSRPITEKEELELHRPETEICRFCASVIVIIKIKTGK